jgi:ribosomal protein S19E (S16A)
MQELEKIGFVAKQKSGRVLTPQGRKFMDAAAKESG